MAEKDSTTRQEDFNINEAIRRQTAAIIAGLALVLRVFLEGRNPGTPTPQETYAAPSPPC